MLLKSIGVSAAVEAGEVVEVGKVREA